MSPVGEYPLFGLDFLLSRKYGKKSRRKIFKKRVILKCYPEAGSPADAGASSSSSRKEYPAPESLRVLKLPVSIAPKK